MDLTCHDDGFWWPADDGWCHKVIHDELPDLDRAVSFAKGRSIAVQAGGNVGVWAAHLAKSFDRVVTVEPMADNYACLCRNVPENVSHRPAALGESRGSIAMRAVAGNAGAHYVDGAGEVEVVTIDGMNLAACDLICLDVEGSEPMALRGALSTIRTFRPVLMFEEKGLSELYYGIPRGEAEKLVLGLGLGYRVRARVRKDVVLAC